MLGSIRQLSGVVSEEECAPARPSTASPARPDALAKILQALGHAVADDGSNAGMVLEELCAKNARRWLEPVYPLWENEAHFVVLSETPESGELGHVEWSLRLEDGTVHAWSADVASLRVLGERIDETGRKTVLKFEGSFHGTWSRHTKSVTPRVLTGGALMPAPPGRSRPT